MPRKYTPEHRQFFIDFVPGHSHVEIAEEFNKRFNDDITPRIVKSYISNHKLNTGRTGRYQKGNVPWSKGRKMSPEQYEKCRKTMFKKGQASANKMPLGSEYVDQYGYTWVKVSDDYVGKTDSKKNWKAKQRLIYEQAHGPIPEGYKVIFLDGDKTNFDVDNLEIVNQNVMVRLNYNHLIFENPEQTRAGIAVAEVLAKIGELERSKKDA